MTTSSSAPTAASRATPTTCATASRPSSTPTTARSPCYVVDETDPIIRAWMAAFPDLFTAGGRRWPRSCSQHLRYPEDLFRVQTNVYSKYQLDPSRFFERDGAWSVAQAPAVAPREAVAAETVQQATSEEEDEPALATETSNVRFVPYYTMFGGRAGAGLRVDAAVRAVLARRPAARAAGVHDGVERRRDVRRSDGVPRRRGRRRIARRSAGDRQRDGVGSRDQRADHAAATPRGHASASATSNSSRSPVG